MNRALFDNINRDVGEDDWAICNGDWVYGVGRDNGAYLRYCQEARDSIRCKNLILIAGNHDRPWLQGFRNLFTDVYPASDRTGNTFGGLEIKVDQRRLKQFGLPPEFLGEQWVFCHYRLMTWRSSNRGSKHFHGHNHGSLDHIVTRNCVDTGVDCWNYRAPSVVEYYEHFRTQEALPMANHHPERVERTPVV